jgi:hypothetical protein
VVSVGALLAAPCFFRRLLIALIVCATLIASPVSAQPDAPTVPRFGVIGANPPDDLGAGWQEITFAWAAFQPDGPQDFVEDSVDPQVLQAAAAAGREVVGRIVSTPAWASASGQPDGVPRGLALALRDPDNTWAAFVRRLAAEYAPRGVHRWIIYDQPNVHPGEGRVYFTGSVSEYAALLKTAFLAARSADPEAAIHAAAPDWWADVYAGREPYLKRLLDVLRLDPDCSAYGSYFDVAMLRVYDTTSTVWDLVTTTRALLDAAGFTGVAIWLETNAAPTLDPALDLIDPIFGISLDQQADFVVQAAALALAAGVERVAVPLDDDPSGLSPWGLIRDDASHRPAFEAYARVIDLFTPVQTALRYTLPGVELIMLEDAEHDLYVLWASNVQPAQVLITSPSLDEPALLIQDQHALLEKSGSAAWPAAFVIDAPGAVRDAHGFLTVAGSPRVLVLDKTDFFRVVYATVNGTTERLR